MNSSYLTDNTSATRKTDQLMLYRDVTAVYCDKVRGVVELYSRWYI